MSKNVTPPSTARRTIGSAAPSSSAHARLDAVSIHSRSDAIVVWRACVEPHGEQVEIESSHCGMSVHPAVYRVIDRVLERGARPGKAEQCAT